MARKFLYVVAILIVMALAASLAYRLWGQRMIEATMVPSAAFVAPAPLPADAYAQPNMWLARPDRPAGNPTIWVPKGFAEAPQAKSPTQTAATFFIHPTTYLAPFNRAQWNMPAGDSDSLTMASRFLRTQASAFAATGPVWAPQYRQAHFGAFLTKKPQAQQAIDAAYADVAAAFSAFLAANPDGPIILAAHSQGSLHLLRLLHDQVAGKPIAARIAAVYAIGWPVSVEADIPALGLPACTSRGQAGCIISWQSFAEPADASAILDIFDRGEGFTGKPRRGTAMLCVNPLTGAANSAASASQNLGTLDGRADQDDPALVKAAVPARCDARGLLLIGNPPDLGPFALPGNNYHVYDYALFWANVRADARERLATFLKSH